MKFKNILNKPYKYGFLYQNNKYYNIFYTFNKINKEYCEIYNNFNIKKKQIQKLLKKFSNNIYKSFLLLNFLKLKLDINLFKLGIMKTIKQSRHLITYGKILINGNLCKNPNQILKIGDCVHVIPRLYSKNLYNNLYIFKNYLLKINQINTITPNNILNINKNIFYIFNR